MTRGKVCTTTPSARNYRLGLNKINALRRLGAVKRSAIKGESAKIG
jgi:hypothetical protein